MEGIVLVTDRSELRDVVRRALRDGPAFRLVTPQEWNSAAFGTTRDRLFILDLPTPVSVRERLAVAEGWPHGFAGTLVVVLTSQSLSAFRPVAVVDALMVEPFSHEEVAVRVRHMQWKQRLASSPQTMEFGGLVLDTSGYEVRVQGKSLDLTFKEYELLRYLASNPGRVCTRDLLLSRVWGEDYYGGTRTVDVHIRRLRVKLGPKYDPLIQTVRNVGYRFSVPEGFGAEIEPPGD